MFSMKNFGMDPDTEVTCVLAIPLAVSSTRPLDIQP